MLHPEQMRAYLSPDADRWFDQLERATTDDPFLESDAAAEFMYVSGVAVTVLSAVEHHISLGQPLNLVLLALDREVPEDERLYDDILLPAACSSVAEKWLREHPGSAAAQRVRDGGLSAPVLVHAHFFKEMFDRFLEHEGITPKRPPLIGVKLLYRH